MSNYTTEIKQSQYNELIEKASTPVILDFYSMECTPCEALAPKFEEAASLFHEHIRFYKIFRQENRELAKQLDVTSSPTIIFFKNGKRVHQPYSGGIKKSDIYAGIRELVGDSIYDSVMSKRKKRNEKVDLVILGAGPAGLTSALYAAQAKLNVLVVDPALPGGQVKTTHLISNYPGTGKPVSGYELMENMLHQAKDAGAKILSAVDVNKVNISANEKKISIDDDLEITADALILAMGSEPRLLGIPGEKEFRGKGIHYCATCDGKYYEDKDIIVVGGGNSAIEESLFLTRFVNKLTVVHQFGELQANKTAQETAFANSKINFIWKSEPRFVQRLDNGKIRIQIENVETKKMSELETDGVFIFVGMAPNLTGIDTKGMNINQWGYVVTDEDMETGISGVYAVGDVRSKKYRQAATAVGDGCIAAIVAEKYVAQKRESAVK